MDLDVAMLDQQAAHFAEDIGIPPCPAILTKLLRETRADDPDFKLIGQLVSGDVALAASVLNTANSPFYGLRTKASTIQQALVLLGLHAVTQLVTGLLLRQAFPMAVGSSMDRYWKSSMATALIAALVSRETGRAEPGGAHTYGLFRDCGMAIMMQKFPVYSGILEGSALTADEWILDIEDRQFKMNHCRIGAHLAHTWQLSEPLCFAILHHHDMFRPGDKHAGNTPESKLLVAIGLVAEQLYSRATGQVCHDWKDNGEGALDAVGLTAPELDGFADRVKTSLSSA